MSTPLFEPSPRPRIWARQHQPPARSVFRHRRRIRRTRGPAHRLARFRGRGARDRARGRGSSRCGDRGRLERRVSENARVGAGRADQPDRLRRDARARARAARRRAVALVTHGDTPDEVRRFTAAYALDVTFASYQSAQDAESVVLDLRDRGIDVVVGPASSPISPRTPGWGRCFCIRARRCVRRSTLRSKSRKPRAAKRVRRQRLDNLLQHLRDGVVALDAQGRVEVMNQRLAERARHRRGEGRGPRLARPRARSRGQSARRGRRQLLHAARCELCRASRPAGRATARRRAPC